MHIRKKLLLLISLIASGPVFAADSSSFTDVKADEPEGQCYLSGTPQAVTFDSSDTTMTCAQKFSDGNYVVVGVSSSGGSTKIMYCQKLECGYESSSSGAQVDFYDLTQ